jgi:copper ion binding protein
MATMLEHVTLTAPDISCAHCVMTIKEDVGALAGVASVEANEATKKVEISFDPNRVSLAQIEATMDEAGYPVAK